MAPADGTGPDRPDYAGTLRSCYLGYVTQAAVVNLAPLFYIVFMDDYGLTFTMLGSLSLINFAVQILVDLICVAVADRVGYRALAVTAHAFAAAGLASLGILPGLIDPPFVGIVISVAAFAVGGGMIEVLVSPIVDALPGEAKASSMSLLHSFYSWGQVSVAAATTALLHLLGLRHWWAIPMLWALIPAYNAYRFARVPLPGPVAEGGRTPLSRLLRSPAFISVLAVMVCSGAAEQAMSQWASLFAEAGLGISKVLGDLLGPALFAAAMGVGRTLFGIKGRNLRLPPILLGSSLLCVLTYCMASLSRSPAVALLGLVLCGLAVSLLWPGTLSLASARFPMGGTAMFAMLAVFGDVGCSLGPWLTGLVSDLSVGGGRPMPPSLAGGPDPRGAGLRMGLLSSVAFPALMAMILLASRKGSGKGNGAAPQGGSMRAPTPVE
ncbi:MAG: MFS transporter [Oscillospiraceae bacterium]|nr:MFS transporter [Oscillospiraceae bacterium]